MNSTNIMGNWRNQRLVKFLGVGMLNTLVGYCIYAGLVLIDLPYLLALLAATIAGVIFNYFSFGRMVFKARGGWLVFGKFILVYAVVYVINANLLNILTQIYYLDPYLGQVICILPNVVIGWLLMSYWVYKNG